MQSNTFLRGLALALAVLCLASVGQAQQPQRKLPGRFDARFAESSAEFWAGATFDYLSTRGKREGNPFLQSSAGGIDARTYFAVNGALYGLTVTFHKRYPRAMNWTRRVIAYVHIGVGFRNLTVEPRHH